MPPAHRPFVRVQRVSKIYPTRNGFVEAVEDVSLEVREAEFLSILGPSGCGKSTLLLMIAGLLSPTSGEIWIQEGLVKGPCVSLGIVFQRDVLLDWRTVLGNVMVQAEVRGLDRPAYRRRALELLEQVALSGFEDKYPFELSGGMRQRVSLCRALLHDPPLLLMDEPFGALDALTRDQMNLDLLRLWDQRKKTVVFITHSISEAVFLSDKILVMTPRPGRVQEVVDVCLPRPRTLAQREAPEFAAYSRKIIDLFTGTGVLREG